VVSQWYEIDPVKEHAIRGNNAVMKCQIPAYVSDFLSVTEWHTTSGDVFATDGNSNYG